MNGGITRDYHLEYQPHRAADRDARQPPTVSKSQPSLLPCSFFFLHQPAGEQTLSALILLCYFQNAMGFETSEAC